WGTRYTAQPGRMGRQIYETSCMSCHGSDRKGSPPSIPSLLNVDLRRQEYREIVQTGRNSMPAFRQLRMPELAALAAYISSPPTAVPNSSPTARRYSLDGY